MTTSVINVHSPTEDAEEDIKEKFYQDLEELYTNRIEACIENVKSARGTEIDSDHYLAWAKVNSEIIWGNNKRNNKLDQVYFVFSPITQMLSEAHDTDSINNWLKFWVISGLQRMLKTIISKQDVIDIEEINYSAIQKQDQNEIDLSDISAWIESIKSKALENCLNVADTEN
ncbi:hypothetical protein FQA39_LY04546 [Lamprigera yunnana]|nr:hypothetical protein FQA39_LY04546 [Lamprigera yunnana]